MATGDITYGTRTALANVSRIDSIADGQGRAFGEIQGGGEIGINIHIDVPIVTSASGTYELYLIESQDGAEWTDDIDPTADTGDVSGKVRDAVLLASVDAIRVTTDRELAEFHVQISMLSSAEYIGFVFINNSGQTLTTGSDGDSVTYKVS